MSGRVARAAFAGVAYPILDGVGAYPRSGIHRAVAGQRYRAPRTSGDLRALSFARPLQSVIDFPQRNEKIPRQRDTLIKVSVEADPLDPGELLAPDRRASLDSAQEGRCMPKQNQRGLREGC